MPFYTLGKEVRNYDAFGHLNTNYFIFKAFFTTVRRTNFGKLIRSSFGGIIYGFLV